MFAFIRPKQREMFAWMVAKHVEMFVWMVTIFDILTPGWSVGLNFVPHDGYVLEQRVVENYPSAGNEAAGNRG